MQNELPLRDIHLPDPVSWWPPAPGWWLLIGGIVLLAGIFFLLKKYFSKKISTKTVLAEFDYIVEQYEQHKDTTILLQSLSVFMRRACISFYPRSQMASVTGKQWLQTLDKTADKKVFSQGIGSILATAPYLPANRIPDIDSQLLIDACKSWLLAQQSRKKIKGTQP